MRPSITNVQWLPTSVYLKFEGYDVALDKNQGDPCTTANWAWWGITGRIRADFVLRELAISVDGGASWELVSGPSKKKTIQRNLPEWF
jgi:hypothetical protein